MHRSGTSCLTGSLKSYGLELGDVSNYNKNNLKGNQENRDIFRLNEAVLEYNGGNWFSLPNKRLKWNNDLIVRQKKILNYYSSLSKPWGIKDPRMLAVFPFWENQLSKNTAMVGTFRNPLAVAQSLSARKKLSIPIEDGLSLWNKYNQLLIKLYEKYHFPVLNFDLRQKAYLEAVQRIAQQFGLQKEPSSIFFDTSLRNQTDVKFDQCSNKYLTTYQELLEISDNSFCKDE